MPCYCVSGDNGAVAPRTKPSASLFIQCFIQCPQRSTIPCFLCPLPSTHPVQTHPTLPIRCASTSIHLSPFSFDRRHRILKFLAKRKRRVWTKKIKYSVRKNFADSRLRLKGRFVKKEEENTLKTSIMERLEKKLGKEELDNVLNDETRLEEEVALLGVTLA